MSLDLGTMYVLVSLEDGEYKQKLNKLEDTSTNAFQNIAKAAAAYLTLRAVSSFVQGTVNMFSDLEEETNKFNVVFAGLGKETSKILAEMREDFGLSELSAKRMLAGTGDMLTGFGFDPKLALTLSEGAAKLGADIASFSNYAGGAAGATSALTKAMLGETESAKMLGVVIKQDSEEYKNLIEQVMTTGIKIKALGDENIIVHTQQQAKAVAALALAYQQSPNAIGDFKRSSDSIANQTRILENNFEELTSKIGGDLAPAYRDALALSNELIKSYNNLSPTSRALVNNTVALTAAMTALSMTRAGRGLMTFKGNSAEDIAAAKQKATENVKRAEVRMTTAQLEKDLARQNVNLARNAVAAAENASKIATAEYRKAKAMRNTAAMVEAQKAMMQAQKDLTDAKLKAAKAESELTAKTSALTAATDEYNQLSAGLPALLSSIAATSTLAGNASIFLSGGLKAAGVAVKTFFASIGPVGWAILAIGGTIAVASSLLSAYNKELEENAQKTAEAADGAAAENDKMRQNVSSQLKAQERLQELAKYERLSNSEREEAQKILKDLKISYDENGKSIDEMISKNGKETRSLKELIAVKKEQLKQERISKLKDEIEAQQKAIDANDNQRSGAWGAFWRETASAFGADTVEEIDERINKENQARYDSISKARAEIDKLQQEGVKAEEDISQKAQDTRKALESLADREWNIRFNTSDVSKQVGMINEKIQEVFNQQSGKYSTVEAFVNADRHAMTEQEIKDLETIIELEARRADLKKQSVDYFQQEQQSYIDELRQQERRNKEAKIEKEIRKAEQGGNGEQARAIMERELAAARLAAKNTESAYRKALALARKDELATDAERKRVAELKRKWQESLSDQNKWQSRIDMQSEDRQRDVSKAVGSFSLQLLASQLGGPNKPEVETAKNTKRTKELLEQINENMGKTQVYK